MSEYHARMFGIKVLWVYIFSRIMIYQTFITHIFKRSALFQVEPSSLLFNLLSYTNTIVKMPLWAFVELRVK